MRGGLKLRLRELARIPRLKLADEDFFDVEKWEAAGKDFKKRLAKFVAENPKGGVLVGKPVIHPAETRWDVSYPKIKKTGITLVSPDIESPGKWRTTFLLRQKVLGKDKADFLDKTDYAKGAIVPHSHNVHDTLADAYDDARAARGETARFTKKNIFSAKVRLRELAYGRGL
jgi:hypothetical protein